jgi:putative transposase
MAARRSSTPTKGCQFTSHEFTGLLKDHGIQISMDGKGLLARQRVCGATLEKRQIRGGLFARLRDGWGCASGLARYLTFYNQTRPHQALDGQTPDQVYYDHLTTRQTAA